MDSLLASRTYAGRNRVLNRSDALDILWRQSSDDWIGSRELFPCESPYVISAIGLPSFTAPEGGKVPLEIPTRCRKCQACLKHRRRLWTARAIDEIKFSSRTWFGTLTYHPEARFMREMQAASIASDAGIGNWRALDEATTFQYLQKSTGKDLTDYLKRVRKSSKVDLRYLLVCEAHKDGFPHYHMLLHERALPVTKKLLEEKWRFGFSHWRLVDNYDAKAAYYACKYLTKDHKTRIRGSVRYGQSFAQKTERSDADREKKNACQKGPP